MAESALAGRGNLQTQTPVDDEAETKVKQLEGLSHRGLTQAGADSGHCRLSLPVQGERGMRRRGVPAVVHTACWGPRSGLGGPQIFALLH